MILVDTSVWVDHFRRGNRTLVMRLEEGMVMTHAFVIAELACGALRNRGEILKLLSSVPAASVAGHSEFMAFVEMHHLMGRGLGYVDVHLLASASLDAVALWTLDRRLASAGALLGVA